MKLASFDIFDTILIRKCGKPANIFYLLARQSFPDDELRVASFLTWRKQAEQEACRKYGHENVAFGQIYESFDEQEFGQKKEAAAALEKEIESQNLIVNPQVEEIIQKKRTEGYQVCFISDMYFDSGFLRKILESHNLVLGEEEIFVSNEWNSRKSTSELFGIVKKKYKPEHWEHYGDNHISDYVQSRKAGIKAFRINTGYTPAEEYIEKKYKKFSFYPELSVFTGFQRAARITEGNTAFSEMGADFVAPVYISYVRYVLKQARKQGFKRLYFVNRDGYILLKIAEMFAPEYPGIELKYIFISRRSIVLPALVEADPALFTETLNPPTLIGKKVGRLLNYLDIDREQLEENDIAFSYDRITNPAEADDFTNKIFRSSFTPAWETRIRKAGKRFKAYLDQEGVTDGTKSALVDLGWYGSTRLMLNRILDHHGYSRVPFFYFSVAENAIPVAYGEYFSYMPYPLIQNTGVMPLMEHYFSACPYGSVYTYEEQNGSTIPVLDSALQTVGYKQIISANKDASGKIVTYCRELPYLDFSPVLEVIPADYLQIIAGQQVKINLEACSEIGAIPDFDGSEQPFLKKLTRTETLHYTVLGKHITEFDRASVAFTYRPWIAKQLYSFHVYSEKLRRFFYVKYMAFKQKRG